MPHYDYLCKQCGKFEVWQKMSDPKLKECPDCSGEVRRLISGGSTVIFRGDGFYETDYKRKEKPEDEN